MILIDFMQFSHTTTTLQNEIESVPKGCYYHWLLLAFLVIYVVFNVIWYYILKKQTLSGIILSVSLAFTIVSFVFGIIGFLNSCSFCIFLFILNIIVTAITLIRYFFDKNK